MNVLIIEDENPAAQRLEKLLKAVDNSIVVIDRIPSVKKALRWFYDHPVPDLVFMDIQLSDGLSFEIFEHCQVSCPVIFTTAYDAYALKAFKVNSIDYLLKPIDEEQLQQAFTKMKGLGIGEKQQTNELIDQVAQAVRQMQAKYKNRFLVKVGEQIHAIPVHEILYFYSGEKASYCYTQAGRNHLLDFSLEQIEAMVNPEEFFRVNRQYLISFPAVAKIVNYSNSRLKLVLQNQNLTEAIVSRERVQEFKNWLDR